MEQKERQGQALLSFSHPTLFSLSFYFSLSLSLGPSSKILAEAVRGKTPLVFNHFAQAFFPFNSVFIIYCYITNHPKTQLLNITNIQYFAYFCGLGIQVQFSWVPQIQSVYEVTIQGSTGVIYGHPKSQLGLKDQLSSSLALLEPGSTSSCALD